MNQDPEVEKEKRRSTGRLVLKIVLIVIGVAVLLFLAFVGLVIFMCSKH